MKNVSLSSTRDRIRDSAEALLRIAREPLHNSKIADHVLQELALSATVTAKTVNTCLHDDPQNRFLRVGPGTWTLKEFRR